MTHEMISGAGAGPFSPGISNVATAPLYASSAQGLALVEFRNSQNFFSTAAPAMICVLSAAGDFAIFLGVADATISRENS